jgi:hypothetical protein
METVDSKQKQLPPQEIIAMAATQQDLPNVSGMENLTPAAAMLAIANESSFGTFNMKQFGNTLFLYHRGTGKHGKQINMRPINVDTAANFANNVVAFMRAAHKEGIRQIQGKFRYVPYVNLFKLMARRIRAMPNNNDVAFRIAKTESGAYVVQGVLGEGFK